ncbi:hypothetical protein FACS1894172_19640 [Spirochaetia bacterium]|nr:hypothetical protein FACS1894164_00770 [Spirochaetia bacterium]GHU36615.1 hypothetical protein FACS1894172_19640 [Spirochaetia bacterium]
MKLCSIVGIILVFSSCAAKPSVTLVGTAPESSTIPARSVPINPPDIAYEQGIFPKPLRAASVAQNPGTTPYSGQTPAVRLLSFEQETKALRNAGNAERPSLELSLSLTVVEQPDSLKKVVYDTLYGGMTPEEYRDRIAAQWKANYNEMWNDNELMATSSGSSLSGSYFESHDIVRLKHLFSVKRNWYAITGGAHGNYASDAVIIDLDRLEWIALDAFFKTGSLPDLWSRVEKLLNTNHKTMYSDGQMVGPTTFFVNESGFVFHWAPYEIASYAEGAIEIPVAYKDLSDLLSPRGLSLVTEP